MEEQKITQGEGHGEAPSSPATASGPPTEPGGAGGESFDFKSVPAAALGILRDPVEGIGAQHRRGQHALFVGLTCGLAAAILIPLANLVALASWDAAPKAGLVLKQCLGGVVFLGAVVGLGFLLRGGAAQTRTADWRDDLYLAGGAMLFLLAGFLAATLISLIRGQFFGDLAQALALTGLLLMGLAYHHGLQRVARFEPKRAAWGTALIVGLALLAGGLLAYRPAQAPPMEIPAFLMDSIEAAERFLRVQ
jgi:hypothetical protein